MSLSLVLMRAGKSGRSEHDKRLTLHTIPRAGSLKTNTFRSWYPELLAEMVFWAHGGDDVGRGVSPSEIPPAIDHRQRFGNIVDMQDNVFDTIGHPFLSGAWPLFLYLQPRPSFRSVFVSQ